MKKERGDVPRSFLLQDKSACGKQAKGFLQPLRQLRRATTPASPAELHHRGGLKTEVPFVQRGMASLREARGIVSSHPSGSPATHHHPVTCTESPSQGRFSLKERKIPTLITLNYSFLTNNARIALRTSRIITPTSAKIANHILATPMAPNTRQINFTPMAKIIF